MLFNRLRIIVCIILSLLFQSCFGNKTNNKSTYPFLADIVDLYCAYYLQGPNNLTDLEKVANDMVQAFPDEVYYYKILNEYTFPKLKKISKELQFIQTDCSFSIKHGNKILCQIDDFSLCCFDEYILEEEKYVLRIQKLMNSINFFDEKGEALLINKDLRLEMWNKLKQVYQNYNFSKDEIIAVNYLNNKGIDPFCEGIEINKTKSVLEIEEICSKLCSKHAIDRIIFYIPFSLLSTKNEQ